MTESVLIPEMTDEQYKAEAESLLAQMRLLNEESQRLQVDIEKSKANTRRTLQEIRQILSEMKAR